MLYYFILFVCLFIYLFSKLKQIILTVFVLYYYYYSRVGCELNYGVRLRHSMTSLVPWAFVFSLQLNSLVCYLSLLFSDSFHVIIPL